MTPHPHGTARWPGTRRGVPAAKRRRILTRDPDCKLSLPGCTLEATEVDHVIGVTEARRAGWTETDINDEANLQGACNWCHAQKTARQAAAGRRRASADRARNKNEQHPGLLS